MVFYDGEYLCVQLNKNIDYNIVLKLAKEAEYSRYYQDVGIYCLPPTRRIANTLFDAGYKFDKSAMIFLDKSRITDVSRETSSLLQKLYPFQRESVNKLLSTTQNWLIADEMGLGKTVQALMYLKLNPSALPAIVICPASLKLNWAKEVRNWVGIEPYVLNGRKEEYLSDEFLEKYPIWIINYDILGSEDKQDKEREEERKRWCDENGMKFRKKRIMVHGWCDEIDRHIFKTIICDEVQYIAEPDTLRSRGVKQICLRNSRKIFLSGTPYETKTSQFFTCLNILDKSLFPNRWKYLMDYCNPKKTRFGWKFEGLSNADELHEKISKVMIRRLKKDVLTQLPPKTRIVVPLDVSREKRKIYDDKEFELDQAIRRKEKNALSKLAELRQASFEAKREAIIQWIKDYLEVNDKLVVFVYHKKAFHMLMDEFNKISVGINGETPNALRQEYVERFQNNKRIKLFIGQIKATNAGLTLTASNATCFVEFPLSYPQAVQCEDRVHRISQEADAVFSYYLILDNSLDNAIMQTINERSININKVMDNLDDSLFKDEYNFNELVLANYKENKEIIV